MNLKESLDKLKNEDPIGYEKLNLKYFKSIEQVFSFGKHKGKKLIDIYKEDSNYVHWCIKNIKDFKISPEIFKMLK